MGFSGTDAGTGNASALYDGDNSLTIFQPAAGGYRTTDGYSYLSLTNLPNSTLLRIKVDLTNNNASEIWVIDDALIEGISSSPCTTPTAQPTALSFSNITNTSFDGSFSAAAPSADSYLVVYSTSATLGANPIDTTTYLNGDTIGSGTVLQSSNSTSFSLTGLSPTTTYYVFIFSHNSSSCSGGPSYNTLLPLTNNETTLSGPCLEESFTSTTFAPTNWISSGTLRSTTAADYNTAPAGVSFNSTNGYLTTDVISNPSSLDFYLGRSGNSTAKTFNINVSTTSQTGPFTTVAIFDHSNVPGSSYNQYTVDLSVYSADPNVWIQFEKVSSTTSPWRFDDVSVTCSSICTPTHTITSFAPTSGPVGTAVTIIGTGFTAASTVEFNATTATVTFIDANTLIAVMPNTTTGVISVTENSCKLDSSTDFTLIINSGSCSSSTLSDLIISEVYDSETLNVWYMELYNPTSLPIDLDALTSDYEIERFGDIGDATSTRVIDITGVVSPNSTFLIKLGDSSDTCSLTYDFIESGAGINGNDEIKLVKNGVIVDVVEAPINTGYSIIRNNTAIGPSITFNAADWNTNSSEICSDLAVFSGGSTSTYPTVDLNPLDIYSCETTAIFTTSFSTGNGGTLTSEWFYNDGVSTNWTIVTSATLPSVIVSGETTSTLTLSGGITSYNGYQFYCLTTEDGACSVASNASQLKVLNTIWDGASWSNGTPNASTAAIINASYNTFTDGSITACSLIVNTNAILTVQDLSFIDIENDIIVYDNGKILVQKNGSVVQNNPNATTVIIDPTLGEISVTKETAPINNWYEYTYWSSPVQGALVQDVFVLTNANRRFWYNANNYQDSTMETNNDNSTVPGQDNVDDNGDVWQIANATDILLPGVGYAATLSTTSFNAASPGIGYAHLFEGPFNNGTINVPVYRNDTETMDLNSNFIGNPYPSAIDTDLFFAENTTSSGIIDGHIFLWSHNTQPSGTTNGNSDLNFSPFDYAIINLASQVAGGEGVTPTNHIPSGQAFFVNYSDAYSSTSGNVVFNNDMRVTGNNNQFFRTSNTQNPITKDIIWLDLTSDNGARNQISISYLNGATAVDDGASYDSQKTTPSGLFAILYSLIPGEDKKFSIQGKASTDLNLNEEISIGLSTSVDVPTIYSISIPQLQGDFFNNNTIYLEDSLMNTVHDLSNSAYSFTSSPGEFNDRFKIVFNPNTLSIEDLESTTQNFSIIELQNDAVKFSVTSNDLTIKTVEILDVLGRSIYQFNGSKNTEIYNLSKLSSSVYIAKVELSNGKFIIKKAIKK